MLGISTWVMTQDHARYSTSDAKLDAALNYARTTLPAGHAMHEAPRA